ncbi:DNA-binding NarL/FixJ family response regulator [Silvibacterium bohemicum]|uniref:DNA-binding NarL/FixJ family response regulator n=1 Tax=Silvibacterium bohemicum TaxID=1577686 RepID=A0A841JYN4_9BACT|nr:response regulator transcription factor [Silvibacterium bohemicum]MBB6143084.1 DNA-binding NarL/FixJ family response regulator [Silvibacterium bohemicum]
MPKRRVLIADDHALVAEGLKSLLQEEYDVVGLSTNGRRLLIDAAVLKPDVIVLDVGMPELNGIDAAVQLCKLLPTAKMVFVTQQIDVQYLRAAFRAGAVGYVAKQSATQELLIAIRRALLGQIYVTPLLKDALPNTSLKELRQPTDVFAKELTPRQREVLQLVAEGKTIKEISAALQISSKTVEFHKNALMNEIGLRTTADLTRYAIARGIALG